MVLGRTCLPGPARPYSPVSLVAPAHFGASEIHSESTSSLGAWRVRKTVDATRSPRPSESRTLRRWLNVGLRVRNPKITANAVLPIAGQFRWRDPDLNRGHHDFQSCALPTELSRHSCAAPVPPPGRRREAGATGLEPATSDVTGRRSNQLNYAPAIHAALSRPKPGDYRTPPAPLSLRTVGAAGFEPATPCL